MLSPINFFTCIILMWHADASVMIYQTGVDVGDNCFECGEELVLSCQIDSYSISMSWQNDSSSVPFAQCVFDSCTLDQDVANNFVFSTNTSTGIFNLTFIVSNYNNGTTYMCTDGSISNSSLVLTKDYRPSFNNTIPGQLIAMSGCVNKDVIVDFTWELQDGSEYTPTYVDVNQPRDELLCMLDTECGAADSVKYMRTIKVDRGGAGDQRLKVIVSYNKFPVDSFFTEETYIVNVAGSCVWDNSDYIYLVFMVLFLLIDIILVVVFFCCIFVNWTKKNDWEFSRWVYILTVLSCIPLFVTGVMTFLKFDSCSGELYCTCKAWIIVGYIEIGWLILHVIFGVIVILCTRKQCGGANNCSRNVDCVCSMFFLNVLGLVILLFCWLCHKGNGEDNSQDKHAGKVQAYSDQEKPITPSDKDGSTLPIIAPDNKPTKRMTKKQNAQIHAVLTETGGVSHNQTEQNIDKTANSKENSKDVATKGLDADKSGNATVDISPIRKNQHGKISGHQTEQNINKTAKSKENSKDVETKGLDANKSGNATEDKSTTRKNQHGKISGHQTEQNIDKTAKSKENSKDVETEGLDANKSENATEDKSTTRKNQHGKISGHQTEQSTAKLKENSKDEASKGLDANKSGNATEDKSTTTKAPQGKISPAGIKDPIHIDVKQEGQHTQATDITNKNGTMNRSLSALFSPDEQLKNTKR